MDFDWDGVPDIVAGTYDGIAFSEGQRQWNLSESCVLYFHHLLL
jgi:hypothetical protein